MLIDAAKSNGDKEAFAHSYERVKARHLKRIDEMKVFLARYQAEAEDNKDDEEKRNRAQTTVGRIETIIEGTKGTLDRLEALAKKLKS
jgi:DNA-binding transcriptional regulator GbsR (MarR family)